MTNAVHVKLGFRSPRDGTGNKQCRPYGITGAHRQIPGEILKKEFQKKGGKIITS